MIHPMVDFRIMHRIRRWHTLYLRRKDIVVFVSYPATEGARDFVDESLIRFFNGHQGGAVTGSGSFLGVDQSPIAITDVDLNVPFLVHRPINVYAVSGYLLCWRRVPNPISLAERR